MFWQKNESVQSVHLDKLEQEINRMKKEVDRMSALVEKSNSNSQTHTTEFTSPKKSNDPSHSVRNSSMFMDFDNIDAFSIERNTSELGDVTIIGHWLFDENCVKIPEEWQFFCSEETHERLASEFQKKVLKKANNT